MTDIAIRVEGIGKKYRIGARKEKGRTFRETLSTAAARPFKSIGAVFGRGSNKRPKNDFIWALDDINLEVKRGEVLGIVGRNGAGKSTLLKVLSRITEPTVGYADIAGRVGSLLEVGTGFHPELTGSENIYLNGAILGMKKVEIDAKFDQIVEFSEVDRFIDTPVKRYSSGMYLRLAFAVAAHLETEILLVDEVLAVGDAEFQKKCLTKMGTTAEQGRTVVFVSHNLEAMQRLCTSACLIESGQVKMVGDPADVVAEYLGEQAGAGVVEVEHPDRGDVSVTRLEVAQSGRTSAQFLDYSKPFEISVDYEVKQRVRNVLLGFDIVTDNGTKLFRSYDLSGYGMGVREPGTYRSVCTVPAWSLQRGKYFVVLVVGIHRQGWITRDRVTLPISIGGARPIDVTYPGFLCDPCQWDVVKVDVPEAESSLTGSQGD